MLSAGTLTVLAKLNAVPPDAALYTLIVASQAFVPSTFAIAISVTRMALLLVEALVSNAVSEVLVKDAKTHLPVIVLGALRFGAVIISPKKQHLPV